MTILPKSSKRLFYKSSKKLFCSEVSLQMKQRGYCKGALFIWREHGLRSLLGKEHLESKERTFYLLPTGDLTNN